MKGGGEKGFFIFKAKQSVCKALQKGSVSQHQLRRAKEAVRRRMTSESTLSNDEKGKR